MADIKISALTDLNAAPAADDKLVIVDNSVSQTKRVDIADLFTNPNVTGTVTADGLLVQNTSGDSTARVEAAGGGDNDAILDLTARGSGGQFRNTTITSVGANSATGQIQFHVDNSLGTLTKVLSLDGNGDISFYEDTGTTAKFFWDASAESLGIGTSSPQAKLDVSNNGASQIAITNSSGTTKNTQLLFKDNVGVKWRVGMDVATNNNTNIFQIYNGATATASMSIDSSGNVGIGTASPSAPLHIEATTTGAGLLIDKTTSDTSTVGTCLSIFTRTSGTAAAGLGSKILFVTENSNGTAYETAYISAFTSDSASAQKDGVLSFSTADGLNNPTERARIDSSGNLLVGKSGIDLTAAGIELRETGLICGTVASSYVARLNRNTTDGDIIEFRKDNGTVGSIGTTSGNLYINDSDAGIRFSSSSDEIAPCTDNGANRDAALNLGASNNRFKDLYLSGGVYLGGTGAANKLDDYEEGTWTPVLVGSTSAGTATFVSGPTGTYTKIGNQVTIWFDWNISAHTGTGALRINGLPFTSGSPTGIGAIMDGNYTYSAGRNKLVAYPVGAVLRIYQTGDGVGYIENVLDSSHQINGTVTYTI